MSGCSGSSELVADSVPHHRSGNGTDRLQTETTSLTAGSQQLVHLSFLIWGRKTPVCDNACMAYDAVTYPGHGGCARSCCRQSSSLEGCRGSHGEQHRSGKGSSPSWPCCRSP